MASYDHDHSLRFFLFLFFFGSSLSSLSSRRDDIVPLTLSIYSIHMNIDVHCYRADDICLCWLIPNTSERERSYTSHVVAPLLHTACAVNVYRVDGTFSSIMICIKCLTFRQASKVLFCTSNS